MIAGRREGSTNTKNASIGPMRDSGLPSPTHPPFNVTFPLEVREIRSMLMTFQRVSGAGNIRVPYLPSHFERLSRVRVIVLVLGFRVARSAMYLLLHNHSKTCETGVPGNWWRLSADVQAPPAMLGLRTDACGMTDYMIAQGTSGVGEPKCIM